MELSFVIAALRRKFWLVGLCMLVGLVGGLAATSSTQVDYEAAAELLVQPRTSASGTTTTSDPDRFIAGEIVLIKGAAMADEVRSKVSGAAALDLGQAVRVEQKARTDVVTITVKAGDPTLARDIANAYADAYVSDALTRDNANYDTEVTEITTQLEDLTKKIEGVEVERSKIPLNSTSLADRARDAQLFEQTSSYRALYTQLLATQTNLRYSSKLKSRSEVLQRATLPTAAVATPRSVFAVAGLFLGAVVGAMSAVVWANSSKRLLDVVQLEEILGVQSVGELPLSRELAADRKVAFENLPDQSAAVIDQLCVRAEASAQGETDALTIAVVGSQRGAGASTVALALAGRFARNGARTVLIDADLADPAISRSFNALDDAGIPGLLARLAANRTTPLPPGAPQSVPPDPQLARVFTPTSQPDVRVLGVGAPTRGRSLHRTNVDTVIEASSRGGVDAVVIDGGPLLDAASTVRLCQVVDVVVLVVPTRHQLLEPLGVINRLLGYRSGDLLAVTTKLKPVAPGALGKPVAMADSGDVDDIIEAATRWRVGEGRRNPPLQPPLQPQPTSERPARAPRPATDELAATFTFPASPRLGAPPARRSMLDRDDSHEDLEWNAPRAAPEADSPR